jgi:hypothetical protein
MVRHVHKHKVTVLSYPPGGMIAPASANTRQQEGCGAVVCADMETSKAGLLLIHQHELVVLQARKE